MPLYAPLILVVEAVEKVSKQILGRDAEKSDLIECATTNDLMLGKGQETPENIVLTRQNDFSYRLVMPSNEIDMDVFEDARFQFLLRTKMHDGELSIGLKGHLVTEYLINRIIDEKVKNPEKKKGATYSQKLNLMKTNSLLPPEILMNLRLLNSFRNKLAHELDVSIEDSEMVFYRTDHGRVSIKPKKGRYPERYYLRLLTHGVLTQLINHMLLELKVDPRWRNSTA